VYRKYETVLFHFDTLFFVYIQLHPTVKKLPFVLLFHNLLFKRCLIALELTPNWLAKDALFDAN